MFDNLNPSGLPENDGELALGLQVVMELNLLVPMGLQLLVWR
jgi:hypothetical protein